MTWDFTIKGYAGDEHPVYRTGTLVVESTATNVDSRDIEIEAMKRRISRGELSMIEVINHIEGTRDVIA